MDRIDTFDRFLKKEMSEDKSNEFLERLYSDKKLESDFQIYSMIVAGIREEAEQDNLDFGKAMKQLSKEQLFEVLGRQPRSDSNERICDLLSHPIGVKRFPELSTAAALNGPEDEDQYYEDDSTAAALSLVDEDQYYEDENTEQTITTDSYKNKENPDTSLRRFTVVFITIIIVLLIVCYFFL